MKLFSILSILYKSICCSQGREVALNLSLYANVEKKEVLEFSEIQNSSLTTANSVEEDYVI